MHIRSQYFVVALAAVTVLSSCAESDPLLIPTESGMLQGAFSDEGSEVRVFKGVPYARPPVGADRWRPPSAVESWEGVRVADRTGAACWQVTGRTASIYSKGITEPSEDCLYLNVWAPPAGSDPQPVMVWFHGGGNRAGEGGSDIFDGTALASKSAAPESRRRTSTKSPPASSILFSRNRTSPRGCASERRRWMRGSRSSRSCDETLWTPWNGSSCFAMSPSISEASWSFRTRQRSA